MNLIKKFRKKFRKDSKDHYKNFRIMIFCFVSGIGACFWIYSLLAELIFSNLSNQEVIKISLVLGVLLIAEYILASVFFLSLVASIKEGFSNIKDYSQKGLLWHLPRGLFWALIIGSAKGLAVGFGLDLFKKIFSEQFLELLGLSNQTSYTLFAVSLFGWVVTTLIFWFMLELALGLKVEFKN